MHWFMIMLLRTSLPLSLWLRVQWQLPLTSSATLLVPSSPSTQTTQSTAQLLTTISLYILQPITFRKDSTSVSSTDLFFSTFAFCSDLLREGFKTRLRYCMRRSRSTLNLPWYRVKERHWYMTYIILSLGREALTLLKKLVFLQFISCPYRYTMVSSMFMSSTLLVSSSASLYYLKRENKRFSRKEIKEKAASLLSWLLSSAYLLARCLSTTAEVLVWQSLRLKLLLRNRITSPSREEERYFLIMRYYSVLSFSCGFFRDQLCFRRYPWQVKSSSDYSDSADLAIENGAICR